MNVAVASYVAVPGAEAKNVLLRLDSSPAHLLSVITLRHEASQPDWVEHVLIIAAGTNRSLGKDLSLIHI